MSGCLALVGGGEFTDGCSFDAGLWAQSGAAEVLVLADRCGLRAPAAARRQAVAWFAALGATGPRARRRSAARRPRRGERRGGSPARGSSTSSAVRRCTCARCSRTRRCGTPSCAAWDGGAVLAGSSAGAMVLCDPMVDPRGGAFTLGLGLLANLAVIPAHDHWSADAAAPHTEDEPARARGGGHRRTHRADPRP